MLKKSGEQGFVNTFLLFKTFTLWHKVLGAPQRILLRIIFKSYMACVMQKGKVKPFNARRYARYSDRKNTWFNYFNSTFSISKKNLTLLCIKLCLYVQRSLLRQEFLSKVSTFAQRWTSTYISQNYYFHWILSSNAHHICGRSNHQSFQTMFRTNRFGKWLKSFWRKRKFLVSLVRRWCKIIHSMNFLYKQRRGINMDLKSTNLLRRSRLGF